MTKPKKPKKAKARAKPARRRQHWTTYVYKVLKQVHPDTGLRTSGRDAMESLINGLFRRLAVEAGRVRHAKQRATLYASDVRAAVKTVLSGELAGHAVAELERAVTRFTSSKSDNGRGGKRVSQSVRAGLQFPVGRVATRLRDKGHARRQSRTTAVALATVLEYVTAELLELAGNVARDEKRVRITDEHLHTAIRNDVELRRALRDSRSK